MFFLLCSGLPVSSSPTSNATCNSEFHNVEAVKSTAVKAKEMLEKFPTSVPISERLVVMILFAKGFHGVETNRLKYLHCALLKLQHNMGPDTTIDVFIWTLNTTAYPAIVPTWFTADVFPRMHIIEVWLYAIHAILLLICLICLICLIYLVYYLH